jgi:hypothetical protein
LYMKKTCMLQEDLWDPTPNPYLTVKESKNSGINAVIDTMTGSN